jgi:xanthosine utilization system XapX-like protein
MDKLIPFLKARLAEKSTKAVIVTLLGVVVGSKVSPENIELIATAAIAVLAAIAAFVGEDKKAE